MFKIEIHPVGNSFCVISVRVVNCPKSEQRTHNAYHEVTIDRSADTQVCQAHFIPEINANIYRKI
jgi:hypothetical protein